MEEFAFLCSGQESTVDELKLKIRYTALELGAVKAKANEELNKNTESLKQLLHLLNLVYHERDEARHQIQQLLNKITPPINNSMISDRFVLDQVNQINQNQPLMKSTKANSSIEESNSLSDAYNYSSSPVDSLFDPVTSPDFTNINTNNTFFAMHNHPEMDHDTLMMESLIKGKVLPQKGKLLQAVMEVGPLLQTLYFQNHMKMMIKQPQPFIEMPCGSFSDRIGSHGGGSILSFNDVNPSHSQGGMVASCPRAASNLGPFEKRQRFQ